MLNINSPTVQAMMQSLPQGVGNMPVYYGNTPVLSSEQQSISTPYPSPKEMLIQSGQQNVYTPTAFTPRNIVGGYNPGFEAAFNGYINPYMGYGYSSYGFGPMIPLDEETKLTLAMANSNGLDYEEQIKMESELYKKMSRITSINCNRSEEESNHFEKYFEVYEKHPQQQNQYYSRKPISHMHVKIKVGDNVVADMVPSNISVGYTPPNVFDDIKARDTIVKNQIKQCYNNLYNSASERRMDNVDMLDFFNNHAGSLLMEDIDYMVRMQAFTNAGLVYNKDLFQKLLNNNGIKTRSQRNAVDRFVGRYGIMPDGRPVSPGHDPAVATSFSYNPSTGQYSITAPNFISDRLEKARQKFISSID